MHKILQLAEFYFRYMAGLVTDYHQLAVPADLNIFGVLVCVCVSEVMILISLPLV